MADQDTGLPIRSEADGADERVHIKVVDGTVSPAINQMEVDADNNAHTEGHGNDPAGTDRVIRTSELGSTSVDGEYDASNNTDPSQVGLVGMDRNASPADTQQTLRLTGKANATGDVRALDVGIRDENAEPYNSSNPLPVSISATEGGTRIHDENTTVDIAKDATSDHDFPVPIGSILQLRQVLTTASGKLKSEVFIGDGASPVEGFTKLATRFNSTSTPNADVDLSLDKTIDNKTVPAAAARTVRVTITNRDKKAMPLYSTIIGVVTT